MIGVINGTGATLFRKPLVLANERLASINPHFDL
jgi:hypothetical protein